MTNRNKKMICPFSDDSNDDKRGLYHARSERKYIEMVTPLRRIQLRGERALTPSVTSERSEQARIANRQANIVRGKYQV
jgi:hypothetical protein